jgi:predicted transcriptional regulator
MGDGDAATAATPPPSGSKPPSTVGPSGNVERLRERLREAARRREGLMERQRDAISKLRRLHRELDEAVDADVVDPVATSDTAAGGEEVDIKEELKRLQDQVSRQLEVRARALGGE